MKPTLHLLMGLPGAGKTTFAKHLEHITGAQRLSSDEVRLKLFPRPCFSQDEHDHLYHDLDLEVEDSLASGKSVIYDANLNRRQHRQEKYTLAKKYDATVILWWIQAPEPLAMKRRVDEQNHLLLPEGETPQRMFERIAAILEAPDSAEPHTIVNGTIITDDYVRELLAQTTKGRYS